MTPKTSATERCTVHLCTALVLIKPPTPTRFWRRHPQVLEHDQEVPFQGILHVIIHRIDHVTDEFPDKTGGPRGHDGTDASVVCHRVCLELGEESFATAAKITPHRCALSGDLLLQKSLDQRMLKVKMLDKNVASHELLGQATVNLHAAEEYYYGQGARGGTTRHGAHFQI
jgi:hypothetical protein